MGNYTNQNYFKKYTHIVIIPVWIYNRHVVVWSNSARSVIDHLLILTLIFFHVKLTLDLRNVKLKKKSRLSLSQFTPNDQMYAKTGTQQQLFFPKKRNPCLGKMQLKQIQTMRCLLTQHGNTALHMSGSRKFFQGVGGGGGTRDMSEPYFWTPPPSLYIRACAIALTVCLVVLARKGSHRYY